MVMLPWTFYSIIHHRCSVCGRHVSSATKKKEKVKKTRDLPAIKSDYKFKHLSQRLLMGYGTTHFIKKPKPFDKPYQNYCI